MLNVVVVRGHLSRPVEERVLPASGERVLSLEVTVRRESAAKAESVPVSWLEAPLSASTWEAGEEVVVVGHVARRFFRAGGSTQSRTEVVARTVVQARSAKKAESLLVEAMAEVESGLPVKRR